MRAVHAVRDRGDRHLVDRPVRPERMPHLARDRAVKLRDAVRPRRRPQRERGQAEDGVVGLDLAELGELLPATARTARRGAPTFRSHELRVEDLVAGRHRRVRREHRRGAQPLERLMRIDAFHLDELAQPLELEEGGVPLVHVEHRRLRGRACGARERRRPRARAPGGAGSRDRRRRACRSTARAQSGLPSTFVSRR